MFFSIHTWIETFQFPFLSMGPGVGLRISEVPISRDEVEVPTSNNVEEPLYMEYGEDAGIVSVRVVPENVNVAVKFAGNPAIVSLGQDLCAQG
jgi:hypothetical protein